MKQKKWLLTTLTACAVAFSAAFVGCKKNSTEKPLEEGPETGTYYLEDEFGENLLTLSGGEYFTFTYRGKDASGILVSCQEPSNSPKKRGKLFGNLLK